MRADTGELRTAAVLTAILVAVLLVASAVGLWAPGVYQDPPEVEAVYRGYDLVTLVLGAPLLGAAAVLARRGSVAGHLVWLGLLAHFVYNSANYLFGTGFGDLFLLQVAQLPVAITALVLVAANTDAAAIRRHFRGRTPVRVVAALLAAAGGGLGVMWVFYSLRFAVSGARPAESELVLPLSSVHLGYVLDLGLLVPALLFAAVLLWRRAAWGFVLGSALAVFCLLYQLNYLVALVSQARAAVPGATGFDPAEPVVVAAFGLAAALLFGNLRRAAR